ncbi:glycosyltransferase family 9 protein [Shewanella waksmanii]|uniref:glycosyltransferase family 9 protein n=1 Tax=Shewanella waksmanii TaxID=213783 RepID=UPI00048B2A40|nr:glycosyltransferase family 9 protein [Shewanella waksmanii]
MPIISAARLAQCQKMLFMSPVALGDFLYLKTFLVAFKQQFPHITIDIWLDDNRCNSDAWRLSRSKILQQWMDTEGAFNMTFGCTDSNEAMQRHADLAKKQQYDIIFCHTVSKSRQYSHLAREISAKAFIVSSIPKKASFGLLNSWFFRHSDATFVLQDNMLPAAHHITDRYQLIFEKITGMHLSKPDMLPNLVVPTTILPVTKTWLEQQFPNPNKQGKLLFMNHLSTNVKKDWPIEYLFSLIKQIAQASDEQRFIINTTPESYHEVSLATKAFTEESGLQVAVFTVNEHFFELPSLIAAADFVITVDTAILHFAFAAKRPLLAMMRQKKPYWAPPESPTSHVMYATEGKGHIADISVERVLTKYTQMIHND